MSGFEHIAIGRAKTAVLFPKIVEKGRLPRRCSTWKGQSKAAKPLLYGVACLTAASGRYRTAASGAAPNTHQIPNASTLSGIWFALENSQQKLRPKLVPKIIIAMDLSVCLTVYMPQRQRLCPCDHDVFQMDMNSGITNIAGNQHLIPSSGRAVLCETLKSTQCHSCIWYIISMALCTLNGYDCDVSYKCMPKVNIYWIG